MKIKCPNCELKFEVTHESMRKHNKPYLKCPQCLFYIILKPNRAYCFHCNHTIKYYKFQFNQNNNITKCKNCNGLNKVQI